VYAQDLSELARPQLEIAFGRARRELKFFPKISELLELASAKPEDARKVEADAAWNHALDYLRKWGVDRMPVYSGGKRIDAPMLSPRIEYALRKIGGLRCLNQITTKSRPFVQKDFIEAYHLAPMAESLALHLGSMFGDTKLLGQVKQLTSGARLQSKARSSDQASKTTPPTIKRVKEPLSAEQMRDRAAVQKQALADWRARRGGLASSAMAGDLSQKERKKTLKSMEQMRRQILISADAMNDVLDSAKLQMKNGK
jgi:hypothetical protein